MPNNMMTLDLSHGTHTSLVNISVASGGFVIVIIFTVFSNVLEYVNDEGKLYCQGLSVEIWNCLVSPSSDFSFVSYYVCLFNIIFQSSPSLSSEL